MRPFVASWIPARLPCPLDRCSLGPGPQACRVRAGRGLPFLLLTLLTFLPAGCGKGSFPAPGAADRPKRPVAVFPPADAAADREQWFVRYAGSTRIGTRHEQCFTAFAASRGAHPIGTGQSDCHWRVAVDRLQLMRFGSVFQQQLTTVAVRDAQGTLLGYGYLLGEAAEERRYEAVKQGDRWRCTVTAQGRSTESQRPVTAADAGPFAIERSLSQAPLAVGQRRRVTAFVPLLDRTVEFELVALGQEQVRWPEPDPLAATGPLLHLEARPADVDPSAPASHWWVNSSGEILKRQERFLDQQTFRVSAKTARRPFAPADLDLGIDVGVALVESFPRPHQAVAATYDILSQDVPLEQIFAQDTRQRLEVDDRSPHRGRLNVSRVGPDTPIDARRIGRGPGEEDLASTHLIQSDDPRVRAIARAAVGKQEDPWLIATALERYIYRILDKQDVSQVFTSAAEVAVRRRGDCSEHAVLLAAACRARRIPARVAVGLVYSPEDKRFVYHMWTEVWIRDRWVGLDATLGRGGVGPAHLKMRDSSLAHDTPYWLISRVIRVIGKLQISLADARMSP